MSCPWAAVRWAACRRWVPGSTAAPQTKASLEADSVFGHDR